MRCCGSSMSPAPLGPHGHDDVAILFTANAGAAPAPLAKAASGGELSRVRLALEVVLAAGAGGRTFVFDEVDAGVGGAVALEIGRRLARLAEHAAGHRGHPPRPGGSIRRPALRGGQGDGRPGDHQRNRGRRGARRLDELARMMAGMESSANAPRPRRRTAAGGGPLRRTPSATSGLARGATAGGWAGLGRFPHFRPPARGFVMPALSRYLCSARSVGLRGSRRSPG